MHGKCKAILLKNAGSLRNANKSETTAHRIPKLLQKLISTFYCFHSYRCALKILIGGKNYILRKNYFNIIFRN